jgi:NitT/TauT family transport system permease protein
MEALKKTSNILVGAVLLVAAWQAVVLLGGFQEALLPSPLKAAEGIATLFRDGTLFVDLRVSLFRFLCGYLIAAALGIGTGLVLGRLRRIWEVVDPIVQVLRPISPIAWAPFIVLWFGIGSVPAIVIVFLAAFFPILLATTAGVHAVDLKYMKLAQNLEIKKRHLLTKIIFPAAFPSIVGGLRIAVGTAWVFLVSGEMVGAQSGLGYLIIDSRNLLRLDLVMAGIVLIGICGLLLDWSVTFLVKQVERKWGMAAE